MSSAVSHVRGLLGVSFRGTPGGIRHVSRPQCAPCFYSTGSSAQLNQQLETHCEGLTIALSEKCSTGNTRQYDQAEPESSSTPGPSRWQPTPSGYLCDVLQRTGHVLGSRQDTGRTVDLSRINLDRKIPKKMLRLHKNTQRPAGLPRLRTLPTTLGRYIQLVEPLLSTGCERKGLKELDSALSQVFTKDVNQYLASRGYSAEDIVAWAWVLTSKNAHQAVSRMFMLEADHGHHRGSCSPYVPPFIPMFLLKEPELDVPTFRLLLIFSLHVMSGQPLPSLNDLVRTSETVAKPLPERFEPRIDLTTGMIMVVRLIRHARKRWPESLPVIARAFARFLIAPEETNVEKPAMRIHKLNRFKTEKLNSCLWLLSLPTNVHPYRSISIQQQAQFELLRTMANHQPVLHVTRKGYRAIVAVQVAHKKTAAERQSAELKAPSWPPWKEERLGIDAQRGNTGMYSRAINVLSQMKEAGYSHQLWEQMCTVLAGWDTDHSPTVQTRTLVRRPRPLSHVKDPNSDHYAVWAARIRATRTVREAWACFLSYQDRGLPPKPAIYAEMARKLIFRRKTVDSVFDRSSHSLPGDGPEVYPEPSSARDIIYVHTEPPTVEEFLEQMFAQGIRPSGRFLALLLQSAPSFRSGLRYLQRSTLTNDQIRVLCTVWSRSSHYERDPEVLQKLPEVIFSSFIQFLCDHSASINKNLPRDFLVPELFPILAEEEQSCESMTDLLDFREDFGGRCHPRALWHAMQLVKSRKPHSLQVWNKILFTLTSPRLGVQSTERSRGLYRIIAWHEALAVLHCMQERDIGPVPPGFHALCVAFSRAVGAGMKHPHLAEEALGATERAMNRGNAFGYSFDAMVENGLVVLKSQFDALVLLVSRPSELAERSIFATDQAADAKLAVPDMLHVPGFGLLHCFVRALGLVGDDDGLLHLLRWMSRSSVSLNELADEHLNGDRLRRRTLVAIRVFLERLQSQPIFGSRVASDSAVQEAFDIVSRTPGWEWPSDDEVEEYCR